MMKNLWRLAIISPIILMASCIKDEAPNMECDIESAWVEGDAYSEYFFQPAEMKKDNISSTEKEITFIVRSLISLPTQIPLNFKITPGATIQPANGSMQDFTKGPVTYTVTSEDGEWKRTYTVQFKEPSLPTSKFSFDNIDILEAGLFEKNCTYHQFFDYDQNGNKLNFWASGNAGFALSQLTGATPEQFPTYQSENGYEGKCVCLQTMSTGQFGAIAKKPIAAGNLFLGRFIVDHSMNNPLRSTEFGVQWDREPVRVKGFYKFKPGKDFTNLDMEIAPNRTDEASIYAVFYRNVDANGEKYFLYGDDVADLDKLEDNPQVFKVARVSSLPPTDEWTPFEMFFEGKDAPDDTVTEKGFNLALVFSSSKTGAQFEGAVGSTLYVDEVEVSYEK